MFQLSKPLLFQFAIAQFITAYATTQELHRACHGKRRQPRAVKRIFQDLLGAPSQQNNSFPWTSALGELTALEDYCHRLLVAGKGQSKPAIALFTAADAALTHARKGSYLFTETRTRPLTDKEWDGVIATSDKVSADMLRIAKALPKMVYAFASDESVGFCLLRHQAELDAILGVDAITQILHRMNTLAKTNTHFILAGYQERGFSHLLPGIQSKLQLLSA